MKFKVSSITNLFVGIVFLFAIVFAIFSLMNFFAIPMPSIIKPIQNLSILYCVQPIFILFSDLLSVDIGSVGEYFLQFFNFSFYLLLFIFSIALGVRQMLEQRSKALTIFVEILHVVNMISALLVIILYLIIDYFISIILLPALILFVISLVAFVVNIREQKKHLLEKSSK